MRGTVAGRPQSYVAWKVNSDGLSACWQASPGKAEQARKSHLRVSPLFLSDRAVSPLFDRTASINSLFDPMRGEWWGSASELPAAGRSVSPSASLRAGFGPGYPALMRQPVKPKVPRLGFLALAHPITPKPGMMGAPENAREPSLARDDRRLRAIRVTTPVAAPAALLLHRASGRIFSSCSAERRG